MNEINDLNDADKFGITDIELFNAQNLIRSMYEYTPAIGFDLYNDFFVEEQDPKSKLKPTMKECDLLKVVLQHFGLIRPAKGNEETNFVLSYKGLILGQISDDKCRKNAIIKILAEQ